jgi:hypothetical protein
MPSVRQEEITTLLAREWVLTNANVATHTPLHSFCQNTHHADRLGGDVEVFGADDVVRNVNPEGPAADRVGDSS